MNNITKLSLSVILALGFSACGKSTTDEDPMVAPVLNKAPKANAGDDISVKQGQSVMLTSSSTDSDGTIVKHEWLENGKVFSTESSLPKVFDIGVHDIVLKVTDDKGASSKDSLVVKVEKMTQENTEPSNQEQTGTNEPESEKKPETKPEEKPAPETKPEKKPEKKPETKPETKPEVKPTPEKKPEVKPEPKDTQAPTITTTPINGETINPDGKIVVKFSEDVKDITDKDITFKDSTGKNVEFSLKYDKATNTLTITPNKSLEELKSYTVTFNDTISDLAGNKLKKQSIEFNVKDLTNPTIKITTPTNDKKDVALDTDIKVVFSEDVKTIDEKDIMFKDSKNADVKFSISYDKKTKTLTIKPSEPLKNSNKYTITLKNTILDLADNSLIEKSISFITKAKEIKPTPNETKKSKVLKTGQTDCYAENSSGDWETIPCTDERAKGQDGYYALKGLGVDRSYTRANGIVTDNATKLQWQDDYSDNGGSITNKEWEDAKKYCGDLSLGGYTDWRLPSVDELLSIVDNGKYDPAISSVFENTTSYGDYWSSTSFASNPSYAWYVYFNDGYAFSYGKNYSRGVRCVRAGQ